MSRRAALSIAIGLPVMVLAAATVVLGYATGLWWLVPVCAGIAALVIVLSVLWMSAMVRLGLGEK